MATPTGTVPIGSIVMFSGTIDHLPIGWNCCDGSNNTPDLRDLFIVGAGKTYNPGDTGGEEMVTLTPEQIPPHNHGYQQFNPVNDDWKSGGADSPGNATGGNQPAASDANKGGQAHENRPPYYALYYIMRTN